MESGITPESSKAEFSQIWKTSRPLSSDLHFDSFSETSVKKNVFVGVMRSISSVSGEPPEESPPKVRRKLPAPLPKKASQASPCNEVPSESEGADTKVIPQPAEPWDKLRGYQFDVIDNESTLDELSPTLPLCIWGQIAALLLERVKGQFLASEILPCL